MASIDAVRKFHQAFGHPVAQAPVPGTPELRRLRVALIAEELGELSVALGVKLDITSDGIRFDMNVSGGEDVSKVDLVETADALGDLDYVVQGANLVFGIPAKEVFKAIHVSNMSKLGADGKPMRRADGKIMKGPDYAPPELGPIIERARAGYVG